jgi:hypothetical protein
MMNRGDQREDIFQDDQDRCRFLDTLGEACVKTLGEVSIGLISSEKRAYWVRQPRD